MRKVYSVLLGLSALFMLVSGGCTREKTSSLQLGIFSWKKEEVENREETFSLLRENGFTEVYQYFSHDLGEDEIKAFIMEGQKNGIRVYALIGEPSLARKDHLEKLQEEITRVSKWEGLYGIMADIEPYLLEQWKTDATELMSQYVENMKTVHAETKLELLVCVPYYYDNDHAECLEELVKNGCDGLAVMNYYRKNEAAHIKTEIELCNRYDKAVINIFELKKPGTMELQEINTYHGKSITEATESWEAIRKECMKEDLGLAFHDLASYREVTENE